MALPWTIWLKLPEAQGQQGQLTDTARRLAGEPGLMEYLKNRRLPILELKEITGKSRRFLEKGRKYIIAVALIITRNRSFTR